MLYIHSNYGYFLHKVASRSVNMFWPCPGFSWDETRVHLPVPSFLGKKSWCPGFILEKNPMATSIWATLEGSTMHSDARLIQI